MQVNPATNLSFSYSVADLSPTKTGLPNLPEEGSLELRNLGWTAEMLEALKYDVGPFDVISAFRTHEVQNALTYAGEPTNPDRKSFHEAGLAVDIFPTTMTLETFYGKLAALVGSPENPGAWFGRLSEIAYKPKQNSIHLALAVEGSRQNVFLSLNSIGKYAALTADEIADFASPFLNAVSDVAAAATSSPLRKIVLFGGIGSVLLVVLMIVTKRRTA